MAQYTVPAYMPMKVFWVYFTGAGLIAAAVSMLLGRLDKLATTLLAVFLLLMVFLLHIPNAMANDSSLHFCHAHRCLGGCQIGI